LGHIISSSMRQRIPDHMKLLRDLYRVALKDNDLQDTFDEL